LAATCRNPATARAEPSTINEKTIADFTRVVEQTGNPERGKAPTKEAAD
jgi:hypothetical protein